MILFTGGSAEISEYEPGWVAKTPRPGYELILELESANYRALAESGLPIPQSRGIVDGRLILEHLDGVTMLTALRRNLSRAEELGRVFLDLWEQVHAVPPVGVVSVRTRLEWGVGHTLGDLPSGDEVLCHYDFHADNILLTADGPVIIDWVDALAGPVGADYARTLILLGIPGRAPMSPFTDLIYRYIMSRPDSDIREWMPLVAAARLGEGGYGEQNEWLRDLAEGRLALPLRQRMRR